MAKQAKKAAPKRRSAQKSKQTPAVMGRPTKYRPEYADAAKRLCETAAATTVDLADFFKVDIATVKRWMIAHADFRAAIVISRPMANARVEHSLYERAVGYTFDTEKVMVVAGRIERVQVREHVPPDVNAQRLWLMNRAAKDWSKEPDKQRDVTIKFSPEMEAMIAANKRMIPPPGGTGSGGTNGSGNH